jgi:hypothetical protein
VRNLIENLKSGDNGNTLSDSSGKSYVWHVENRLTQVTLPSNGGTVAFKYDPWDLSSQ